MHVAHGPYLGPQAHDRRTLGTAERQPSAINHHSATREEVRGDWATIEADLRMAQACGDVMDLGVGAVDPYFSQHPDLAQGHQVLITPAEYAAADRANYWFRFWATSKKKDISSWFLAHYTDIASPNANSDYGIKYNYNRFRDIYMTYQNGEWLKKDGMWKQGALGVSEPLTPDEIKAQQIQTK